MTPIADLVSKHGRTTRIEVARHEGLRGLAEHRPAQAFICSTEEGFAPIHSEKGFLLDALGVPWQDIRTLANWNRFENENVSLVIVPSRNPNSSLRGLILAAAERCRSYERFAEPEIGLICREFFYNVTYEAISIAYRRWGATRLAISHLTGCVRKPRDTEALACNFEAIAHYCDDHAEANIEYLSYVGCCIAPKNFEGVSELVGHFGKAHHPINVTSRLHDGYEVLDLHW
jgi:hypothetical protein